MTRRERKLAEMMRDLASEIDERDRVAGAFDGAKLLNNQARMAELTREYVSRTAKARDLFSEIVTESAKVGLTGENH